MSKYMTYLSKKTVFEKLKTELQALEQDEEVKKARQFEKELRLLMTRHKMDPYDVASILGIDVPKRKTTRKPRKEMKFKNPETGVEVVAKSLNNAVLQGWIRQYGKEKVDSWRVE